MILITEEFDAYIIVSFVNATLVLSIGETVEEVTDSGFLGTTPTLSCSALGEDALVQVIKNIYKIKSYFLFYNNKIAGAIVTIFIDDLIGLIIFSGKRQNLIKKGLMFIILIRA